MSYKDERSRRLSTGLPKGGKRRGARTPWRRDRDRVLYSPAFRRLAGVTQIVAPHQGQANHNRLIHSLKVGQVARGIAEELNNKYGSSPLNRASGKQLDPDVAETAGLAHDLGHPPFGHAGERALQKACSSMVDTFEGNAQTFRIVSHLIARKRGEAGLDLTRATLRAVLKYPWLHTDAPRGKEMKWGAYLDDKVAFDFAMSEGPRSLEVGQQSLEAAIMDWADDVTYAIHDVEDFYRAGLFDLEAVKNHEKEWDVFYDWYRMQGQDPSKSIAQLNDANKFLQKWLRYPLNGRNYKRDYALARFVSDAVHECIQIVDIDCLVPDAHYKLIIPEDLKNAVRVLKSLVHYHVIGGPKLSASTTGQEQMVTRAFDYFQKQAKAVNAKKSAHLPPLTLNAAMGAAKARRLNVDRVACDAVCELTDLQLISLDARLTGRECALQDLYGNLW